MILFFFSCILAFITNASQTEYQVGVGIHDVTGPIGGVNFMGYAMMGQITQGIHTRLYARAFVFRDSNKGNMVVFCSADVAMISPNIKNGVLKLLQTWFGSDTFTHQNVLLTATHTHSGPGGFNDYLLYSLTSLGYVEDTASAMVNGMAEAIRRAYNNIKSAHLQLAHGTLNNANINRSPTSYLANPLSERLLYPEGDTEKLMTLLRITDASSGANIGMVNWFAVLGTSMNNTNYLVSGDNKGYASYLMEHDLNSDRLGVKEYQPYTSTNYHNLALNGSLFVAAFAQTNEGDVSPNIAGAFCLNTGQPCDMEHSTCKDNHGNPRNELCHAHGPNWQNGGDVEGTRIIGMRQYIKAKTLMEDASRQPFMRGEIWSEHAWIKIASMNAQNQSDPTSIVKTCLPARGYSFAAGTTDGPGAFDFFQGDNSTGNPLWNLVKGLLSKPSVVQEKCHLPKPILLNTGEISFPYLWEPQIVDIQVLQIGSLFILGVPGEFTTMAGRRLKREFRRVFEQAGMWPTDGSVVISGLSNTYSGYVTTYEEYQHQRYEGASTIYGPHTLEAYIQEFKRLASNIVKRNGGRYTPTLPPSAYNPRQSPKDFSDKLISLLPPVAFDVAPPGKQFGDVVPGQDVKRQYFVGDQVEVTFFAGHPRNMVLQQLEGSFMVIEKYIGPSLETIIRQLRALLANPIPLFKQQSKRLRNYQEPTNEELAVVEAFNIWRSKMPEKTPLSVAIVRCLNDSIQLEISNQQRQQQKEETTFQLYFNPTTRKFSMTPNSIKQQQEQAKMWKMIRDDGDWDTRLHWWKPVPQASPISYAKAMWKITARPDKIVAPFKRQSMPSVVIMADGEKEEVEGLYRIKYRGAHKGRKITMHEGISGIFAVEVEAYQRLF